MWARRARARPGQVERTVAVGCRRTSKEWTGGPAGWGCGVEVGTGCAGPDGISVILSLRRIAVLFLAAVLLVGFALAVGPSSASAAGTSAVLNPYEADLVARTNAARADAGLPALAAKPGLTDLARSWAGRMASAGALSHNPDLGSTLPVHGAAQWTTAAENVGQGGSASAVFTAYMNSQGHKDNILRAGVTSIGIGAMRTSNGKVWDVMVFTNAYDGTYGPGRTTPAPIESSGQPTAVTPPSVDPAPTPITTTMPTPTTTTTTPTSAPTSPQLYKAVGGSSIVRVSNGVPVALSFGDWQATGFAAFDLVGSQVVKYGWSSTLYARTSYPGSSSPVVETINGSQWAALGHAAPATVAVVPGSTVRQWQTSRELFLVAPTGELHKLGYQEWLATGPIAPTALANQGYLKLSWDSSIGVSTNVAGGQGRPVGFSEWAAAQFPTPLQQNRFPGDQFTQPCGSATITYAGPTLYTPVTYQQWQAAGFPTPVRTGRC